MSRWREVRFGSFVFLKRGYDLPLSQAEDGEFPVVASTDLRGTHTEYKVEGPVITLGRSGSIGHVQLINENAWPLNTTLYVKDNKGNNIYFIYYFLKTIDFERFNSGAGVPTLNRNHLNSLKIKIPDLETQEKIADVLSTYDELIENNNRRIEILEKMAEEIYKEWFVRMRFPGNENTKFEKGIPEGWEVRRVGDVVNITSSKRVYSSDYVEKGVPFYRSKEVIQLSNGETISEILFISNEKYRKFKEKFGAPVKNDILLTSVGTIGVPMLVRNNDPFYFKDGNLTWIQSGSNPILATYIYYWLKSETGQQQLLASTIGTSQSALTIEKLNNIRVIMPQNDILLKFNNLINDFIEKISNLQTQNQNLIKQRDLLLPRLMNGTIEVK